MKPIDVRYLRRELEEYRRLAELMPEGGWRTAALEEKIDVMEAAFERKREFVLYGENEVSARLDVARAVVRRAERQFCRMIKYYTNSDRMALQYLNRLSDYLYVCARYASDRAKSDENEGIRQEVITRILKDMGDN